MKTRRLDLFVPVGIASCLVVIFFSLVSGTSGTEPINLTEYLPTPRPSEPCDICEPNNLWDQACGPLDSGRNYQYFIRCTASRDDDFYYIDVDIAGTVTLDLTSIPANTDYDIYLYDENKIIKCYSNKPGNQSEHVDCNLNEAGRYYIRVYPYSGCNENDPYTLTALYPTPAPTPAPTSTLTPPCNIHIDDFGDTDPQNNLGKPSGWELDPPGCINIAYNGHELQLDGWASGECAALYTTTLSLDASPYNSVSFEIKSDTTQILTSTVIGLKDNAGHEVKIQAGDFMNQVITNTWQGVNLPLQAFATTVDISQLDTLFFEIAGTQGTLYLDNLRLETPLAPLYVDNFDDLTDPNALGGGFGIYKDQNPGTTLQTAYITTATHDNSPGSYAISYTLPSGEWALWETYLLGLDVSAYDFLSFYIKGASGGEEINLYLVDGGEQLAYVDIEDYTPLTTDWTAVRIPLQAFEGVNLTNLDKIKFVFEWGVMNGTIFIDNLRFIASTLLVDNFCDDDENNSLNNEFGMFTSSPCSASIISTLADGNLSLDYDVTAGGDCYAGTWSKILADLNPYRTLGLQVKGERCGQVAASSARTISLETDKLKLGDFLLDGITDQWQQVRIPLAASSVVTDWTRSDSFVVVFEAGQGAAQGITWWDDITLETACAPLWVDNFNDEDNLNALRGSSTTIEWEADISSSAVITNAYGDAGAGMALTYAIPAGRWGGWETALRNVDLSNYDRLIFQIKSHTEDEINPHIYLRDADDEWGFVETNTYVDLSSKWQTIDIQLSSYPNLDMTRVAKMQIIIEWGGADVKGTLFIDNIRFLPAANCDQLTRNQTFLPLAANNYTPLILNPIWDFESGTEEWSTYKTTDTSRAAIDIITSTFRSRWGNASLAMILNLVGSDPKYDRGVAYVDLAEPTDLACKPLSCWVYVPTCGLGDPEQPTTARIFVKDANDKDEYGALAPVQRNRWYKIELRPSTQEPYDGWMEDGFDPHAITRFGVQIRTDSQKTLYRGKIYLDACGWQEIDPAATTSGDTCLSGK